MESDGIVEHRGDTGGDYEGEGRRCMPAMPPIRRATNQQSVPPTRFTIASSQLQATGLRGKGSIPTPTAKAGMVAGYLMTQRLQGLAEPELYRPVGERRHERLRTT